MAWEPRYVCALAGTARAEEDANRVQDVLSAHCARCHGTEVPRPKGDFGLATDLEALARDPRFIVPGQPDASPLLQIVRKGEMPPPKAREEALTPEQDRAIDEAIRNRLALAVAADRSQPAAGAR